MESMVPQWADHGTLPELLLDDEGRQWLVYLALTDGLGQVVAQEIISGETQALSDPCIDCVGITVAGELVLWQQLVDGVYQLFTRRLHGDVIRRITDSTNSVVTMAAAGGQGQMPCVVYQAGDAHGVFQIYLRQYKNDAWTSPLCVSEGTGDAWCPAVTVCRDGAVVVAWDGYGAGQSDIYLRRRRPDGVWEPTLRLTDDGAFHAHVSLAPAPDGGVWVAWNTGTTAWGQPNEVYRRARMGERQYLHARRSLQVRRVSAGRAWPVYPPVQDMLDIQLPGLLHERPRLAVDPSGGVYLAFRFNIGHPEGGHRTAQRWQAMVTRYDGKHWSTPVELIEAYGLSIGAIALLPTATGMIAAATGEGGVLTTTDLATSTAVYVLPDDATPLILRDPPVPAPTYPLPASRPALPRFSLTHHGIEYQVYFGDLHRHTELSFCRTSVDGSLEEAFRSLKDAAGMDFGMTADHDQQQTAPDIWRLTPQMADRLYLPGHFTTFFGYEWIGGENRRHRNIVSVERVPVPPFETDEQGHRDIRATWATLTPGKAITIPHHTADNNMGLRWGVDPGEASDPEFEPVVEIFQASRCSSEAPECPTLCNAFFINGEHRTFALAGGFVSDALQQGLRMGFIASSDHMSTQRSFACVYAEANTREALMDALRRQRVYAATARIFCAFTLGDALMGEETQVDDAAPVHLHFIGTGPIKEITLLRDSIPYRSWQPQGSAACIETILTGSEARGHYFYARMIQQDTNLAWSSPIWVRPE